MWILKIIRMKLNYKKINYRKKTMNVVKREKRLMMMKKLVFINFIVIIYYYFEGFKRVICNSNTTLYIIGGRVHEPSRN